MTQDNTKYANNTDLEVSTDNNASPQDQKDRIVGQILKIINEWTDVLSLKEQENDLIDDRLEETLSVERRNINSQFPPFIMHIAKENLRRMLQPPDFMLEADGVSKEISGLVTDGVVDVMKDGKWNNVLTNKKGGFDKLLKYGDAFLRVASYQQDYGDNEKQIENEGVILYRNTQMSRLYFDVFTTNLRSDTEGKARQCVAVYDYSWEQAIEMYPEIEEKAKIGMLPNVENEDTSEHDDVQRSFIETRKIQIGYYFDCERKIYAAVAGSNAYKLFEHRGKDYPFTFYDTKESYIPIIHLQFLPKIKGLYGIGICGLFYYIDIVWQELMNRGTAYIIENVDPIKIINLPPEKRNEFYTMLSDAQDAQIQGERPVIVNELDTMNPQAYGQLQTMSTPALTNEFERLITQLRLLAGMLGVKLDQLISVSGKPLGTTELELENQNEVAKAIIDMNTEEFEFAVRLAMDAIARDVPITDKTPINPSKKIILRNPKTNEVMRDENGMPIEQDIQKSLKESDKEPITLGDVSEMLRKYKFRVKINTKSGAVKNDVLRKSQLRNLLNSEINPQSPFAERLRKEMAQLEGYDRDSAESFNPMQQVGQAQGGQAPRSQVSSSIPTEIPTM